MKRIERLTRDEPREAPHGQHGTKLGSDCGVGALRQSIAAFVSRRVMLQEPAVEYIVADGPDFMAYWRAATQFICGTRAPSPGGLWLCWIQA
jgi:hypothetical protein